MNTQIASEVKNEIVDNEIKIYQNTLYLLQVRYRVNKKLENAEAMKAAEEEMVKIERVLDELEVIKKEITTKEEKK